jgi:Zn-dependent protease with chaperone function
MTHKKFSIFVLLLLCFFTGASQSVFSDFKKLESKGEIPADFARYIGDPKKQTSTLTYLFKSGFILYGTELNEYLEKIMDVILKDYPDLRKKMRIYVYKSAVVNAMAFDDYIIVVNTGLIAQVQNESELAFILSHEMVHIVNRHIEKQNEKQKRSKKEKREQTTNDVYKDLFMAYHYRSREHEFEADKEGFEKFYRNSGYSIYAVDGVFDVLQYSYLPFDEIEYKKSFLESPLYTFPKSYFLLNLSPIRSREDYIDTLSTHPSISKRRVSINNIVSKTQGDEGALFIQSEQLFYKIRDIARYETIVKLVTIHNYGEAFYNTYIMLEQYPESEPLNRLLIASLYGISKHKGNDNFSDVVEDFKLSEGNIQQTNHFLKKITKEELVFLTLRFAWKNAQRFPYESYYLRIAEDAIQYLYSNNIYNRIYDRKSLIDSLKQEDVVSIDDDEDRSNEVNEDSTSDDKGLTQNFAIKREKIDIPKKDIIRYFMLKDLFMDTTYLQWANKQKEIFKLQKDLPEDGLFKEDLQSCSKILIWNPNCYIISSSFKIKNKPRGLNKAISEIKNRNNIEFEVFKTDQIHTFNTERYNHFCNVQSLYFDRNYSEGIPMLFYNSNNIEDTYKYFGTTYISFVNALIAPKGFSPERFQFVILAPLVPILFPITMVHLLAPNKNCWIEVSIINMASGNMFEYSEHINGYNSKAYINNAVYTIFKNLKEGDKK